MLNLEPQHQAGLPDRLQAVGVRGLLLAVALIVTAIFVVGCPSRPAERPATEQAERPTLGQVERPAKVQAEPTATTPVAAEVEQPGEPAAATALRDALAAYRPAFVDALGQPIAGAQVEFAVEGAPEHLVAGDPQPAATQFITDSAGHLMIDQRDEPTSDGQSVTAIPSEALSLSLRLEHGDYGVALEDVTLARIGQDVHLPLVRRGSAAEKRAVRGQLLDDAGQPLAGAVVECGIFILPGNASSIRREGRVVTSDTGWFAIYLPPGGGKPPYSQGELYPLGTRAILMIHADGRAPYPLLMRLSNDAPELVFRPDPALKDRLMRFESESGGFIEDPAELKNITVEFLPPSPRLRTLKLRGDQLSPGPVWLTPGRYIARYSGQQNGVSRSYEFAPLDLDEKSPQGIVFRRHQPVTYYGRVIDIITGQPFEGAVVFAVPYRNPHFNYALLDAQAWQTLSELPVKPQPTDPAALPLREIVPVEALARTDADGRFEIEQGVEQKLQSLTVLAPGKVPVTKELQRGLKPDKDGWVLVPDVPLIAAARVLVEPIQPSGETIQVHTTWKPVEHEEANWPESYRQLDQWEDRWVQRTAVLGPTGQQPLLIPAGLPVQVSFYAPYHKQWRVHPPNVETTVQAGESLDLGELRFVATRPLQMLVVDEQGAPLEGVPIRVREPSRNAWQVPVHTDANGIAIAHAAPGEAVEARVDMPHPARWEDEPVASCTMPAEADVESEPLRFVLNPIQVEQLRGHPQKK